MLESSRRIVGFLSRIRPAGAGEREAVQERAVQRVPVYGDCTGGLQRRVSEGNGRAAVGGGVARNLER